MIIENKLERYILARWAYAVGKDCIMGDPEYNELHRVLTHELPNNEYVKRPWSADPCPYELLHKYGMTDLIQAVVFSQSSESIPSIILESDLEDRFGNTSEKTRISMKLDGWNTEINYYNGVFVSCNTRGRTGNVMDAFSINELYPKKIPILGKVKVTGETSIPKKQWDLYSAVTGNVSYRASLSTALARSDVDTLNFTAFKIEGEASIDMQGLDLYEFLESIGFVTPMHMYAYNFQQISKCIDLLGKRKDAYPLFTDGCVVENNRNKWAVRVRAWAEEVMASYVVSYVENENAHRIAMLVKIKPIKGFTSNYSEIDVTNLDTIVQNNLQIGYPVAFNIRSSVNSVLDVNKTAELQKQWEGKYGVYREKIDNQERV